ncbi:MAG: RNA polymerase sigma factor SigJ [Verrucomicrobiota bacterium JB022]|nr:RNA polymerase sigma factor SigJ [Verrucomicrobiota bacterium JB022]
MDLQTESFEHNRPTLEGIAYRMLGSLSEAQDIVQETYLRWRKVEPAEVRDARAWLITACSRLALNHLQSARARREQYFGTWLPEPFPDAAPKPLETDETVSMALMVALERLSPAERAAYLLHEVFDYSFDEVAAILEKSNASCRQLAARARKRLAEAKPRFSATPDEHRRLLEGFFEAAREGNLDQFKALLADDALLFGDGGGKATAVLEPLAGPAAIGALMAGVWRSYAAKGIALVTEPHWFNGSPGMLVYENGVVTTAVTLDIVEGRIARIYSIRNPDKLRGFNG